MRRNFSDADRPDFGSIAFSRSTRAPRSPGRNGTSNRTNSSNAPTILSASGRISRSMSRARAMPSR